MYKYKYIIYNGWIYSEYSLEFKCNSNNKYYNSSYFVLIVGIWQWDKSVVVRTVVLL